MYSTVQYMKACWDLTAPSRVQIPRKTHTFTQQAWRTKVDWPETILVLSERPHPSKTHLQQTRISKFSGGQTPGPLLLDPPLNTMNRAANCLTPALIIIILDYKIAQTSGKNL